MFVKRFNHKVHREKAQRSQRNFPGNIFFLYCLIVFFFSCGQNKYEKKVSGDSVKISDAVPTKKFFPEVYDSIEGDFDGDGKKEFAVLEMVKDGNLNLIASDDPAAQFKVIFRNEKIIPLDVGCCDIRLVKEEDLDGDGAGEISVFSNEGNGCSKDFSVYTLKNGKWKELMEPFLVMTGCDPVSDSELEQKVFLEKGTIFYWDQDMSEDGKVEKKKAVMKK